PVADSAVTATGTERQPPRRREAARADARATPAATGPRQEPAEPLPARELVIVPEEPLAPGTKFWVEVSGIRNINGLDGGGGSATFETARAEVQIPSEQDAAGPPAAAPPDSVGMPRPTARDSIGAPRPIAGDSIGA